MEIKIDVMFPAKLATFEGKIEIESLKRHIKAVSEMMAVGMDTLIFTVNTAFSESSNAVTIEIGVLETTFPLRMVLHLMAELESKMIWIKEKDFLVAHALLKDQPVEVTVRAVVELTTRLWA